MCTFKKSTQKIENKVMSSTINFYDELEKLKDKLVFNLYSS